MVFVACWIGLIPLAPVDSTEAASPPAITVRVAPGPYLVGRAIALDVTLDRAGAGEVVGSVEPPRIPQADLFAVDLAAPGSKPEVLARFVLVPRRSGGSTIPAFRVRVGDRQVGSKPHSITVVNVPPGGRPPSFLGGVGAFRVASRLDSTTVRVGQPVEVEITMTGTAAAGSNLVPDLSGWSALGPAFQVRDSSTRVDRSDPPTRTFRYRVRPTKPGRAVLPPVPLAAFDPLSRGYVTRYTSSLPLVVESPPRFDPARVDFGPNAPSTGDPKVAARRVGAGLAALVAAGGGLASWLGWPVIKRRVERYRAGRPFDWRREASRLSSEIPEGTDPVEVAEAVSGRFARAIEAATKTRVAVLTPLEAEAAVMAITDDLDLSEAAERLVARLDRIRFDPDAEATVGDRGLVAEAVAVFRAIGGHSRN